jgi:hypothetical protein
MDLDDLGGRMKARKEELDADGDGGGFGSSATRQFDA